MQTERSTLKVKQHKETIRVNMTPNQKGRLREVMDKYREERAAGKIGAAARRDANMYRIVHNDAMADNSKAGEIVKRMKTDHPGEKAIVHVQGIQALRSTQDRLEKEFGKGSVVVIMGEGPESEVAAIRKAKADFNDPDSGVQFILGTRSMEEGHNLTKGTVTFHLDQPNTYAAVDQRDKRSHRRGQDRDTHSYILSGNNPMDLRKEDLISRKKREMGVSGNPQSIEGMDGTGFLSYLNAVEQEAQGGEAQAAG